MFSDALQLGPADHDRAPPERRGCPGIAAYLRDGGSASTMPTAPCAAAGFRAGSRSLSLKSSTRSCSKGSDRRLEGYALIRCGSSMRYCGTSLPLPMPPAPKASEGPTSQWRRPSSLPGGAPRRNSPHLRAVVHAGSVRDTTKGLGLRRGAQAGLDIRSVLPSALKSPTLTTPQDASGLPLIAPPPMAVLPCVSCIR